MTRGPSPERLWVGLDVGSVTVKVAVVDPHGRALLHGAYTRHGARQADAVHRLLTEVHARFPGSSLQVAACGSGGHAISEPLDSFFIQEVVANAVAIGELHPEARVAVELGGEDAKVIFFHHDYASGRLVASDMRMNGTCAGGTGAFIDQVAKLLDVPTEEFGRLAARGQQVYEISGRCGVFAKTDIQPLLNQCVAKQDIALSTFHAIAKQTIGGLVQGMEIHPPVVFEGGPLTFNPRLVEVFIERLGLEAKDVILPEHPELMVAYGAALSVERFFEDRPCGYRPERLERLLNRTIADQAAPVAFFASEAERVDFLATHALPELRRPSLGPGTVLPVWIGIDAGSTTSKLVLLDEQDQVVDAAYASNRGEPLAVVRDALVLVRDRWRAQGVELQVRGLGTTGYGEHLVAAALRADHHTVETVAHAEAARRFAGEVSFVLDVGGQDMKAIWVQDGIITAITLNEACSAGCGSYIETLAASLGVPVAQVAEAAFRAPAPSQLGSRCTVFMNSSIITEQKNGKSIEEILAGVCRSVVENLFTKVLRVHGPAALGERICVQGGTFRNDAVLRAFEQHVGRPVVRPPYPGEMGAIGIALLTKRAAVGPSRFIGLSALDDFRFVPLPTTVCQFCTNACKRTAVRFGDGSTFVTGNRCEKGAILGDPRQPQTREQLRETTRRMEEVPDLMALRTRLLFRRPEVAPLSPPRGVRIGLPRVLEFWNSAPFWRTLFEALGFEVELSPQSTYPLFEEGLASVSSDTICFPAKLAHGHVRALLRRKVDRLFMPMMVKVPADNERAAGVHMCAVVQGYPLVVAESDEPEARHGVPLDRPMFHWYDRRRRDLQVSAYLKETFQIPAKLARAALALADQRATAFRTDLEEAGAKLLAELAGTEQFAVILAGRPYHGDELVNHDLARLFTSLGVPVLPIDALPEVDQADLSAVGPETVNPFHVRMFGAALLASQNPNLEVAQIVSFGCGHDAIISDEMERILGAVADKPLLVLKLDEGQARGPLGLRIRSFIETTRARRAAGRHLVTPRPLPTPFTAVFQKEDRATRTIMVPNISEPFAQVMSAIFSREGLRLQPLPLAGPRAIALGKRYLHNDICFPAQINVGEFLAHAEQSQLPPEELVLGLAKNCEDCRAGQYAALARKALDAAGYAKVPIVTTGRDTKDMHPGFKLGIKAQHRTLWGLCIMDAMDEMVRRVRPYERTIGETDRVFAATFSEVVAALCRDTDEAVAALERAIEAMNAVPMSQGPRRPRVGVIGEILLNYHPGSNGDLVRWLERNGLEVHLPKMVDFFRRDLIRVIDGARRDHLPSAFLQGLLAGVVDKLYAKAQRAIDERMRRFRFHQAHHDVHHLAARVADLVDPTYMVGEGWLIPAEILSLADDGVRSFVIIQPFGCLPNHITGRGLVKSLKRRAPGIQIVSLDYDPDTSFGNVENRLQMLVMNARALEERGLAEHKEGALA
jgi:predicted CoA-substrate-specific enzyme activase